jgi:D-glycero-D-manno-heptose 1,7-bisphosphate phosphatase
MSELDNFCRAVFLDRDGTLNRKLANCYGECDTPHRPEDVTLLPGVGEFTRRIKDAGYLRIVATNQSCVAKGHMTISGLHQIHEQLSRLLAAESGGIDHFYYCPHYPYRTAEVYSSLVRACTCRKPAAGMLLKAAAECHVELSASWMLGDNLSDVRAGRAAGCRTIFLDTRTPAFRALRFLPTTDYIVPDLSVALRIILEEDVSPGGELETS